MRLEHKLTFVISGATLLLAGTWAVWPTPTDDREPSTVPPPAAPTARREASPPPPIPRWHDSVDPAGEPRREMEVEVPPPVVDEDAPRSEDQAADGEAAIDAHERALAMRLEDEPRDGEWSSETETAIRDVLRTEALAGATLVQAQCRSTLCRAEVALEDEDARERFLSTVPMAAPFATDGLIRDVGEEGAPRMVVYFAREGHRI